MICVVKNAGAEHQIEHPVIRRDVFDHPAPELHHVAEIVVCQEPGSLCVVLFDRINRDDSASEAFGHHERMAPVAAADVQDEVALTDTE